MGISPQIKLFKCGNCGRRYSNPAAHTCVIRASRSPQAKAAKAKAKPKKKGWR